MKKAGIIIFSLMLGLSLIFTLAACSGDSDVQAVTFDGTNGISYTQKSTEGEYSHPYYEAKKGDTLVAYIFSQYSNQGQMSLSFESPLSDEPAGKLALKIYVPYCDTADFSVTANGTAVATGAYSWARPDSSAASSSPLGREMPCFSIAPDTVYEGNVSISLGGLDPANKRAVTVTMILRSSQSFSVRDASNNITEINVNSEAALKALGYDVKIEEDVPFSLGENSSILYDAAIFTVKVGDTFTYYNASASSNGISGRAKAFSGGSNCLYTTDAPEGMFTYASGFGQTTMPGYNINVYDIYKVTGTVFYDAYYMGY